MLYIVAFLGAAGFRLFFAYPLEITEGASMQLVRAILRGQPLYTEPTLEHVPMIYGPVYYYAAALVSLVGGPTFGTLRVVSLVASIGSIGLIGLIIRRETCSRIASVVGAGVFAASYPLADGTLDLGRVDATMLASLLAAFYLIRLTGLRSALIAGSLIALSVLTKQAAAPLALILGLYLLVADRRRLAAYLLGLVVALSVPIALLELQSGAWATLFLFQLPRQHQISELRLDQFWRLWILPRFTLALPLGMLFFFSRLVARQYQTALFYSLTTIGMLGIALASDANPGASLNVLLPAYAMLAILFGLGLDEGLRQLNQAQQQARTYWVFAVCVGILQLVLLIYNPRLMVPYRSDLWADERLAATLTALPGNLFAPDYDAFVQQRARYTEQPFAGAFAELIGGYGGSGDPESGVLLERLHERLVQREYDYVVLDPDSQWFFFSGAVKSAGYVDVGPLFPPNDEFWLWRTSISPRSELYVPRERSNPSP